MDPIDPTAVPPDLKPDAQNPAQQHPPADGGGGVLEGLDVVADGAGALLDGASAADALGCLDGCASCSVALFLGLFFSAGAAFAVLK